MAHDHAHGPGASPGKVSPADAGRLNGRATGVSVAVALVLCAAKAFAFAASGSIAMLATLADSALDLVASLITFFAVRYAASPADAEHRHGHGKAESLAGLAQAMLVAVSAALIVREAIERVLRPETISATGWAIAVMGLSIALTLGLVWIQTRTIRATGSVAVSGDRAHYTADLGANVAVLTALAAASVGAPSWLDPIVGIGVALWLLHGAWQVASGALDQMMDREMSAHDRDEIAALALSVPGVLDVHRLRTRAAGPIAHVQFHLDLDPDLPLRDAHAIVVEVERAILSAYPGADILIHPDPAGEAEDHSHPHFAANRSVREPT